MKAVTIRMSGDAVVFAFDDGHVATFTPIMVPGSLKVVDLASFELRNADNEQVFVYVGRHTARWLRDDDNRTLVCRSGYTPKIAGAYWRAASRLVEYELHIRAGEEASHHIPVQLLHPDAIFKKGYDHLLRMERMVCPEEDRVSTA